MARLLYADKTEVYAFKSTGPGQALLEAADVVKELYSRGYEITDMDYRYETDNGGTYFIVIKHREILG